MPAGLQIWDASGNLTLEITDRITRIISMFTTEAGVNKSGSVTHPELANGTPWYAVASYGDTEFMPIITFSGSTLYWSMPPNTYVSARTIVFGVY